MSQSTNLSVTGRGEAPQPELEALGDQGVSSSSDLSPPPATDETPSVPAKDTTKEGPLFRFGTWISGNRRDVVASIAALLTLVFTVTAIVPSFRSESMSHRALELAEWTALKDFIENCKQDHQAGLASTACQEAITQPLPPPPHVQITSSIIKRWMNYGCKQRGKSSVLKTASDTLSVSAACVMLAAIWTLVRDYYYMECNRAKNTRSPVKDFAGKNSKTSCYETIDHDAHKSLDAQVTEVQPKHRFENISRADFPLSDCTEARVRGGYDTEPWPDEIESLHTSAVWKIAFFGYVLLVIALLSMALTMCRIVVTLYEAYYT